MSTPARRLRRVGLAAVALVPLAFTGLFVAALGQSETALERIPAAIVNEDELITTTTPQGEEQVVFAGRQLVTELTGAEGFDWTITNADQAQAALDRGEVYAVLTIPSNFSESILSLQSGDPRRAEIAIRTDDARAYLTGSVAQVVGQSMTDAFGRAVTEQVIGGLFASLGQVGTSLGTAADGASSLAGGARSLSGGIAEYTAGVDGLADGLWTISNETESLGALASGIAEYTGGVSQVSAGLSAFPVDAVAPAAQPQFQALVQGLAAAAAGGPALAEGASSLPQLQQGIEQTAIGASQLADASPPLISGADQLAAGADELATGLRDGAEQIPAEEAATDAGAVAADPVGLDVTTANAVTEVGQGIATFFIPLGLWVGALAVFLMLRPPGRGALASTATDGRLVLSSLTRAGTVTGIQALLLVGLLHGALGVAWTTLPLTLGFALVTALGFTAFHFLLTAGFGRGGLVVSLLLLALQVTSTGGIYPVELLSEPFQVLGRFLPLTYAVEGMQGIIAGGDTGSVLGAAAVLVLFGAASVVLALAVVRRTRRATALGMLPAAA